MMRKDRRLSTLNDIVRPLSKDREANWKRVSCNKDKQQIPRGDTAKGIKTMFVPRYDGYLLMQFDLSQAELRGLGSFSHDPNLKHAYDQGFDLHTYTAANMWHGGDTSVVTKHERSIAKTINKVGRL